MENVIDQAIEELKVLLNGKTTTEASLNEWLKGKGMMDEEIKYTKGLMVSRHYFLSLCGKWTYRGPDFIEPLPPNSSY